jgi:transcriptional regulator with XRE-family HTH domain
MIHARRRQLELTQKELASRAKISLAYVQFIESGERRPSATIITRLTKVLHFDGREVFFLARPRARAILGPGSAKPVRSAWEQFRRDDRVRRLHSISDEEMETLSCMALLGEVRSAREFIYVLNAVRNAINPALYDHAGSAWEQFKRNDWVRRLHSISDEEMKMLSCVASLGEVRSARDFMFVLNSVRQTMGR